MVYGYCPICGAQGMTRERRLNGRDRCENMHVYQSSEALDVKPEPLELISDVQHKIWSHWMRYLFECCHKQEDGSYVIPKDSVDHWKRQMHTPYERLTEKEKESDRHQTMKVLKVLILNNMCIKNKEG